ncbi:MAG: alpha/beta fold hydrolase [Candidatus Dojkabacteria bacterium]
MEKEISYRNNRGHKISAVFNQVNEDKSTLVIIIAHGFGTYRNGSSSKQFSKLLEEKEISSFRFDFNGHGESEVPLEDVTISEGVDDILSAISYIKSQGFNNIGLLGTSFGGACSIIAASQSKDLSLLVLRSPVSDYFTRELMTRTKEELSSWKRDGFRLYKTFDQRKINLKYNFFEDMKNNRGFESAENINIPTLVVHGDKDESVPLVLSEMLIKAISNSRLKVIKNADHKYSDPILNDEAVNEIINFIVENL